MTDWHPLRSECADVSVSLSPFCDHNRCRMVPWHVTEYEEVVCSFLPCPPLFFPILAFFFFSIRRPPCFGSLVFVWQFPCSMLFRRLPSFVLSPLDVLSRLVSTHSLSLSFRFARLRSNVGIAYSIRCNYNPSSARVASFSIHPSWGQVRIWGSEFRPCQAG